MAAALQANCTQTVNNPFPSESDAARALLLQQTIALTSAVAAIFILTFASAACLRRSLSLSAQETWKRLDLLFTNSHNTRRDDEHVRVYSSWFGGVRVWFIFLFILMSVFQLQALRGRLVARF